MDDLNNKPQHSRNGTTEEHHSRNDNTEQHHSRNDTTEQHHSRNDTIEQHPVTPADFAYKSLKKGITVSLKERWKRKKIKFALPQTESQIRDISAYFNDGQRIVDYVLVYDSTIKSEFRDTFLNAIIDAGLETETSVSIIEPNLIFIKIHGPKIILQKYAEKFDIPIKKHQTSYIRPPIPRFACLRTELTRQDPTSPNFHRAPETFSGDKPKKFLSCERSLIVFNVLKRIEYGHAIFDNGIERLIDDISFCAAFPLHDGTFQWNDDPAKPLNDRQILYKYWCKTKMIFKSQPVDTIGRYFGHNMALYFAWLSFYNKMLILPVLLGVLVYIINTTYYYNNIYEITVDEVCKSELIICPACPSCQCLPLKSYCLNYELNYITDTIFTVAFATIISFWAAVYMGLWKRKQAIYALRWNLQDSELEEQDIRPEFENFAHIKVSDLGESDIFIPWYIQFYRLAFTTFVIIIMMIFVTCVITSIIISQIKMTHAAQNNVFSTIISSLLTVLAILLLRRVCIRVYNTIVIWLVQFEVPKTQTKFDNSYIIKLFIFSFVNNYGSLIYLAFFKGKTYTHPNDPNMYAMSSNYLIDTCDPSGCFSEVHTQLAIIMLLLPTISNIIGFVKSYFTYWMRKKKLKKLNIPHGHIPRWEKDYLLNSLTSEELLMMYEEMVVQFGFLTLFTFAFPFAPFIAWVNSLIKTQIDAKFMVTGCRRPNCKRTANIGAWMDIMKFLTYLSVSFNALYITFTSDFLHKFFYIYLQKMNSLEGYVQHTLSSYYINLDHWPMAGVPNGTECWYPGHRYGPDSDYPFEYKYEYYQILAVKFAFIIIFEHTILGLTALIFYSLPDVPEEVKNITAAQRVRLRKLLEKEASFTSESIIRLNQPTMNEKQKRTK